MSDSQLVQGLRERDATAFQQVCDCYLPAIWRFVYTRVDGDQHLAEDIVSETMLALVTATESAELEISNPGGWLRAVAYNKLQDHYRAAARVRHLLDGARQNPQPQQNSDPAEQQAEQDRRAEVRQAMDQLSDQHRSVLEWKYLDKLSVREIALRWQTTEKAVESILFRARRELRSRLDGPPSNPRPAPRSDWRLAESDPQPSPHTDKVM